MGPIKGKAKTHYQFVLRRAALLRSLAKANLSQNAFAGAVASPQDSCPSYFQASAMPVPAHVGGSWTPSLPLTSSNSSRKSKLASNFRLYADASRSAYGVIAQGERNARLTSIAGSLRRYGLAPNDLFTQLSRINMMSCQPPLPEREVLAIAKSVSRYTNASSTAQEPRPANGAKPAKAQSRSRPASALIRSIWRDSRPGRGSLIGHYLRARGLSGGVPASLRFAPRLLHAPSDSSPPEMIAAVTLAPANNLVAVHRTYLAPDGLEKHPSSLAGWPWVLSAAPLSVSLSRA